MPIREKRIMHHRSKKSSMEKLAKHIISLSTTHKQTLDSAAGKSTRNHRKPNKNIRICGGHLKAYISVTFRLMIQSSRSKKQVMLVDLGLSSLPRAIVVKTEITLFLNYKLYSKDKYNPKNAMTPR